MSDSGRIVTVLGEISPDAAGHTQMHEHLLCDISGYAVPSDDASRELRWENYYAARVDWTCSDDCVLDEPTVTITEIEAFRRMGGSTIVDMTTTGIGRDPRALREISRATGVHVVMGAGYYCQPFHPAEVADLHEDELAARIAADITDGVDDTGVRAGIIGEIGMSYPPHPDELKVLRAAVRAQITTGAALNIHPGRHPQAPFDYLEAVATAGGDVSRTIISHIERTVRDQPALERLAATGCVIEFDMFGMESSYFPFDPDIDIPNDAMRVKAIAALIEAGYADQIVLSQDVCRKTQLSAYGGEGYEHLLRRALPLMRRRGIAEADIQRMCATTPARLLTIGRR